jgi:uncharacterized protein (DUF1330 family)
MLEVTWGLQVDDASSYAEYRAAMTPILAHFGGEFVLDLWVAEVLRGPKLNRLFTIRFPSAEVMAAFFSNPDYLAARERFFTRSVSVVTELSRRSAS